MTAASVVDAYTQRARFCSAEAGSVSRPRWLPDLLATARHVAEVPCGTGHFLADYVHNGTTVTLVDANAAMLAGAAQQAAAVGLPGERTHLVRAYLHEMKLPAGVDLVVMPNAALNQLARQSSLADVLVAVRRAVRPGVPVLAQVARVHPSGMVDRCGFYDPAKRHGVWFIDRRSDQGWVRRRRQHRDGTRLRLDFAYYDSAGRQLHQTTVVLDLLSEVQLQTAYTAAGFDHARNLSGGGCLSEVLVHACGPR